MKNITRHTGKLEIIKQIKYSLNGNPRFLVRVDGWTCKTKANADYSHEVKNFDGKQVLATIGTHYGEAVINSLVAKPQNDHDDYIQYQFKRLDVETCKDQHHNFMLKIKGNYSDTLWLNASPEQIDSIKEILLT